MADELAGAFDFLLRGDMAAERTEPSRFGTARFHDAVPLRRDSNFVHVERDGPAGELGLELERHGLHAAWIPDAELGERLAGVLAPQGWRVFRSVVMAQRRPADRPGDPRRVREVGEAALRPLRHAHIVAEPWGSDEVARQLLHAKVLIAERMRLRCFAVEEDGKVVSGVDLYQEGPVAQIEDLTTAEAARGRGHASALVLHAAAEARAAGAELVFLVADAEDWPRQLYAKLGFDELGRYVKLMRPDPS